MHGCFKKCLSLNDGAGYEELNWRSLFWNKYPEYHVSIIENWKTKDTHFFHWYMERYHKKDPKYNVVQDRMKDYFREITGDESVIFDVGWHTFIYFNPDIKYILGFFPSIYY